MVIPLKQILRERNSGYGRLLHTRREVVNQSHVGFVIIMESQGGEVGY